MVNFVSHKIDLNIKKALFKCSFCFLIISSKAIYSLNT